MTISAAPRESSLLPSGYRFVDELGRRGALRVVRAEGERGPVVIRLESGVGAADGSGQALAELAVLAEMRHPGIARLVDHGGLPGGGRFLARQWVEGTELGSWAAERDQEEIGRVVARMCPALQHLHDAGFVHGDLKPANVIVTPEGEPVLCDFGFASRRRPGKARGALRGSLFALAPEVLMGSAPTPRSDLFAMGALLHQLLVRSRPGAREFYANFPVRSFLDAIGCGPEDLPEWCRDLVVALVHRDRHLRPGSAAEVGRTLASRLGLALPATPVAHELRWPASFGRESWLAEWLGDASDTAPAKVHWIEVPAAEDPRLFANELRLFAALRGTQSKGVSLARMLESVATPKMLDEEARALLEDSAGEILVVQCPRLRPCDAHAIDHLQRSLRQLADVAGQEAEDSVPRLLTFVAAGAPPVALDGATHFHAPRVETADVVRFLRARLGSREPERQEELAASLGRAAAGSATLMDQLLVGGVREGWFLFEGSRPRLRPGTLPEVAAPRMEHGTDADAEESAARLSARGRELLLATEICGGRATLAEVEALLGGSNGTQTAEGLAEALSEVRKERWIQMHSESEGLSLALVPFAPRIMDEARAREMHRTRADSLDGTGANPAIVAAHRWAADPTPETTRRIGELLDQLRDSGYGELGLEALDRLESHAALVGADPAQFPELALERARCWCTLSQPDHALRAIEHLAALDDPTVHAQVELVRARVASLRHQSEEALAHLERAAELDPGMGTRVTAGRIQHLHTSGQDGDVLALAAELDLDELETKGELSTRERSYVESMVALSAFREGQVDEARETTARLAEEARLIGDDVREAALRLNLATMERRSGATRQARQELDRAARLFERGGNLAGLAHVRATLAGILREEGELIAAQPLLASAQDVRERIGDTNGATLVRGMLGLLAFERGHPRSAIEELKRATEGMSGPSKERYVALLRAKGLEMRARIGEETPPAASADGARHQPGAQGIGDPRILTSTAKHWWTLGRHERAESDLLAALALARSLGQEPTAEEAELLLAALAHADGQTWVAPATSENASLVHTDARILGALSNAPSAFDADAVLELAETLAVNGRDDRAARLMFAIAARSFDPRRARRAYDRAQELFERCVADLSEPEAQAFRSNLLGFPDPWPQDLAPPRRVLDSDEIPASELLALLQVSQKLVQQEELPRLLGEIVEHAISFTQAERGFLILQENGQLRFDTAVDSRRGYIEEPDLEISSSVVEEALRSMNTLRVSNAVDDPLLGDAVSVSSLELRSVLCVPFEVTGETRGAIYLDHRLRTGAFDEAREQLCRLLADQAALAIQQTLRREEIRRLNGELQRRVATQEADLASARRALREVGIEASGQRLVGRSPAITRVTELVERAAPFDLPVLILGASGTGKELVAHALHEESLRREAPFVSENCAAIPASLFEAELFGHAKGAFTGAHHERRGMVERADGGTLFLDEIGDMPVDLQAKLLRVLESGEVRRLGESNTRQSNFRLLAATNVDLGAEVKQGNFREDLYYRLDGFRIELPPLSARTEDIPDLVEHFLRAEATRSGTERQVSREVLAALCRRPWPGNVRELSNEVARLCVLSEGDLQDPSLVRDPDFSELDRAGEVLPLAEVERKMILLALAQTNGDKLQAAKMLGISRSKIYQRLRDWNDPE